MRAAGSPFQAKSSQEQKEQWIWWQCQRDTVPPEEEAPPVNVLPAADAHTGAADAPSAVRRHHAAHEGRSGANRRVYILRHQHARLVRQVIRIEIRILQRNPPRVKILQPRCADALQ